MKILREPGELSAYFFQKKERYPGALADTGFLYAIAYDDDRLFEKANSVLDILSDHGISIYANVISRMEFVDLIFRKQVTNGCIQLFEKLRTDLVARPIFNTLKDIRDKDTAARRQNQSYKIDERRLKGLRQNISQAFGIDDWKAFCKTYVGSMLVSEWALLEEDLDLRFVEVLEGEKSDLMTAPLVWKDMVEVMGTNGMRGPDAMIVNLFSKSKFPILITSDSDFETCFADPLDDHTDKTIFIL
ncbi:MAG: hypothetical protein AB7F86_10015 [Bdellovibrionales bacterium]